MDDVQSLIPHRPPFQFIDRIVEVGEDGATCEREVRADEPQFEGHYPGNPIMPGVLLCEACFQAGAVFLARKLEGVGRSLDEVTPVLARIGDARFKQIVKPGDRLTIEVKLKEVAGRFSFLDGRILRDGKVVMTVGFALAMVEEAGG